MPDGYHVVLQHVRCCAAAPRPLRSAAQLQGQHHDSQGHLLGRRRRQEGLKGDGSCSGLRCNTMPASSRNTRRCATIVSCLHDNDGCNPVCIALHTVPILSGSSTPPSNSARQQVGCHGGFDAVQPSKSTAVSCTLQVDAIVIAGFTSVSTFQRLATQSQAEQRSVLQNAFHTIGIDVRSFCHSSERAIHCCRHATKLCALHLPNTCDLPLSRPHNTPCCAAGQCPGDVTEQRTADSPQRANPGSPFAILLQLPRHVHIHRAPGGE